MGYAKTMKTGRGSALIAGASKRGSALIMVMLVVAGITTIVFATQRIALVQFSQSVREEDNLIAGYAAQAGVEDGLARYHFERNVQTGDDQVFRFNLTRSTYADTGDHEIGASTDISEGVDGDFDPNYQYYDLSISYKTQRINIRDNGDLDFPADTGLSRLERDDALILTGFPSTAYNYFLRYGLKFLEADSQCTDINQAFVTLQQITSTSSSQTSSQEIARYSATLPENVYDSRSVANLQVKLGNTTLSSVRLRAFHCPVQFAFATTRDIDGLGSDNDAGPEFDSLTTEILSTGYFGSAKRTLLARIDRQTGNLLGIFDFLLYAGGNSVNTGTIQRGQ